MKAWPKISAIISDLDGVAYRGDTPIDSAVKAFQNWRDIGLPYAFVTNNSTKSADEFCEKLARMAIATTPDRIFTTSAAAAWRLRRSLPVGARVMVIGAQSLAKAVIAQGFELADKDVVAVVAGLDRGFTYEKLAKAQTALLAGAQFVGTNPDRMLPLGGGYEPGAGSIIGAIEIASGISPTIVGKPNPDLLQMALSMLGTAPESTLMVGDQIETDIRAARAAGLQSVLVRTGVPVRSSLDLVPDFDIQSLEEIQIMKD